MHTHILELPRRIPRCPISKGGSCGTSECSICDRRTASQIGHASVHLDGSPWPSYAALTGEDVDGLMAYLRSLPPADAPRIDPVSEPDGAGAPYFSVILP